MACTAVETADTAAAPACTTPVEAACTAAVETAPAVPSPASDSESDSSDSEMDISGLEVGMVVLAKGYGPAGGRTWFRARITKFRPRFPPIVVTFTATHPMGLTQPLLLPQPKVAHVTRADIRLLDEVPEAPAASEVSRPPPPVRSDPIMVHELEGRRVSCERNGRRLDGEVLSASAKGTRFTIEWHDGSQAARPRARPSTLAPLIHVPRAAPHRCPATRTCLSLCARGQRGSPQRRRMT